MRKSEPKEAERRPIKQPPVLIEATQALIGEIEAMLDGPLITYWNNPSGSVCNDDVNVLNEVLSNIGHCETLYVFIKSSGGNGKASLRMVNLLRQKCQRLIALVPLECSSAATMLALGADEIHMGPMAYLTAVDTSLTHDLSPVDRDNDRVSVSLDELNRVIRRWREEASDSGANAYASLYEHVHPLVIGAVDRAESLSVMLCEEILSYHIEDERIAHDISRTLNSKYPSHGYPILIREAAKIGLNAVPLDPDLNKRLIQLHGLYSEMGQKASTDFDEVRTHSNEIINILETTGIQVFYQNDKEWFYRTEERRWITLHNNSSWRRHLTSDSGISQDILHLA